MAATPHKIKVMGKWQGQLNARVYWCPVRQTFIFEGNSIPAGDHRECIECMKRIKN